MAEADRRRPPTGRRSEEGPSEQPTPDEVPYRVEVFEADRAQAQTLLEVVRALDWGEPTPEGNSGRDGVILSGSITTDAGVRTWTTWSPDPAVEPAKCVFFQRLLSFSVDHASGSMADDLARIAL